MTSQRRYEALTQALVQSHRSGVPFSVLSLEVPQSLQSAADIQADVARQLGASIAGWKVGFAPATTIAVSAPLFRNLLLPDAGLYARGAVTFLAIEAEIGFHLVDDCSEADPLAALGPAFVGIEIVRSRLAEAAKAPYPTFMADNIGNGGYVVGPERRDWRELDLSALRCRVWNTDRLIHDAIGGHPQGDPLAPLQAYVLRPTDRLGGLRKGQIVTTGTLCGVIPIAEPSVIRVELEQFGTVSVEISD